MKKIYGLALILLTLFSSVIFSACVDQYKNLRINIFRTDGVVVEEGIVYVLDKDNKFAELNIEFAGIDADELGQIVVYSLPNELITVTDYSYNGLRVNVEFDLNMACDDAKLVVSHLASGKKKEISLRIDQKSSGLTLQHSEYVVGIPKGEPAIHSINFENVVNLLPNGSTDNIYFKIQSSSFGQHSNAIKPVAVENLQGYEDVYTGFEVANTVSDGEWAMIYPVTYLPSYPLDKQDAKTKYQNCLIKVEFKNVLDQSNVQVVSEDFGDVNDIKLIANDDILSSHKLNLKYLGAKLTDDSDDKFLKETNFFQLYEIQIVSESPSKITAFTESNNDIVVKAHSFTDEPIEVEIILQPYISIGDLTPVELTVKVKGELKSDSISVTKNGNSVLPSEKIDIFNYHQEGNSIGSLFMFEPKSAVGTVNSDLSQMRILIDPTILSEDNASNELLTQLKEKGISVGSKRFVLKIHNTDKSCEPGKEDLLLSEALSFTDLYYHPVLEKDMAVSSPISASSRIYIKYVDGPIAGIESSSFGLIVQTLNNSSISFWNDLKPTEINLNFNRVEGVKSMILGAGYYVSGTTTYLGYDVEYIYLNRLEGVDNQSNENCNFIDVKNDGVFGVDDQNVLTTSFKVKVTPIDKDGNPLNNVENPLKIHNGHSKKDDGVNNIVGENEILYIFDNIALNDVIGLIYRAETSIGDYEVAFYQEDILKERVICRVYENLTGLNKNMVTFETNDSAFKNVDYTDEFESDYIVASGQELNISIDVDQNVIDSEMVAGYEFDFTAGLIADDGAGGEIINELANKTDYFNFKHDHGSFNNALLQFVKGTYVENSPQYIYVTITVLTIKYDNIIKMSDTYDNTNSLTICFYIYEEITYDKISINHASMTRYFQDYLGIHYKDQAKADLSMQMDDDLWYYVTGEAKVRWQIDNTSGATIQESADNYSYSATFTSILGYNRYTRTVQAYIEQFDNIFEFRCVINVEKPVLTEKLLLNSEVIINDITQEYEINLKKGNASKTYQVLATNISSSGNVTNPEIVIQVADEYGSAYNSQEYFDVNQTLSTITVKKIEGTQSFKLIIFAKDVLKAIASSDMSGYNNPSDFIMNDFIGADKDKYINAYLVINIILSDGTEEHPYLILNADDFWGIDDTAEEQETIYYQVRSNISLDVTTYQGTKTIHNFKGVITTLQNSVYTIDGVYLNQDTMNLFKGFAGAISNLKFIVRYDYIIESNIAEVYLGLFDRNNGTLTNVSVEARGYSELNGSSRYYFGALAGDNKSSIIYTSGVGVRGELSIGGNAEIYLGGLVGRNLSSIIGCESDSGVGGSNNIILHSAQGGSQTLSAIRITSSAQRGAVGGVIGLNTHDGDTSVGTVKNAFVQANITSTGSNVGGVIGYNAQKQSFVTFTGQASNALTFDYDDVNEEFQRKSIYNVKSASQIVGNENVGGIVGCDENGIYLECDYQVLTATTKHIAINGKLSVGGIAGKSSYGKFLFCSVMSYVWDYNTIKSSSQFVANVADIYGENYVGGLVGSAISTSNMFNGENEDVGDRVVVVSSSVNAFIQAGSEGNIGGILSAGAGYSVVFNVYFIGQLEGNVIYTTKQAGGATQYLAIDNDASSSIVNAVYSICFETDEEGNSSVKFGNIKDDEIFNIDSNLNIENYWWWNENINGGYIFITTDKEGTANSIPIFDLAPNSISATVKNETNEALLRLLRLDYYDFSIDENLSEQKVLSLKQSKNLLTLTDLINVTAEPENLGTVVVNVRSSNSLVVDVTYDGRLIINGVGECELVFSSLLNPNAGDVDLRTIKVVVDYPIGNVFAIRNNKGVISSIENIAKDTTKQYYVETSGYIEENQFDGSTKKLYYKTKTNLYLQIEITHASLNPQEYVYLTGVKDITNSTNVKLVVDLDDKTPFMISALKTLEGQTFDVKIKPYRVLNNEAVYYALEANFDLSTTQGVTNISFSYDHAVVYPNDTTHLIIALTTDIEICGGNVADITSWINELITGTYAGNINLLIEAIKSNNNIEFDIYCEDSVYDGTFQTLTFRLDFEDNELEDEENLILSVKLNNVLDELGSVKYTIIPQRINKIEIKNYYFDEEDNIRQQDLLKPNNFGKIIIDIVPNNGYYDYLEISDVTGNEEIVFIQVDEEDNALSLTYDPSSDGKGIKLYDYGFDKSRIYIRTQISNKYSSKMHTIQVRAYSKNDQLLASFEKRIDVKMLPEIKATYLLPNGEDSNVIVENTSISGVYLANAVDAYFRIETKEANTEVEYSISGTATGYTLEKDVNNFYVLKAPRIDNVGKTIQVNFKTYAYMDNGEFDLAECSIEFTIVEYVIHSVSVSGAINNEISGYFGREVELEFYFDKYDISFFNPETNTFWETEYSYDAGYASKYSGDLKDIYEILNDLNNVKGTNPYLILNDKTKDETEYVTDTLDVSKISLTNNTLKVFEGYNADVEKYLAVTFRVFYQSNKWDIEQYLGTSASTLDYVVDQNYHLNFRAATTWYEPEVIRDEDDFKKMTSGGNYILSKDLVFEKYTPIDLKLVQFDGNGYTITIKGFDKFNNASLKAGLFAQIYKDMIVKNIKVVYQSVDDNALGYTFGNIDEHGIYYTDICNNKDVNYTDAKFGGITAVNEGLITNCVVEGQIAVHASTLESKSVNSGGNYEINFNLGGMVAENLKDGYITNSISELNIFAQANVGGFVHTNAGKIASCGVEKNTTIYGYNVNLSNTIIIQMAGFAVQNSGDISMSYVNLESGDALYDGSSIHRGTMSAKDTSAGFVFLNSGNIYDAFVNMQTGINNNIFAGFVYSNAGSINRAYTYINNGIRADNNDSMFAPAGTKNLNNCIEIYVEKAGYSSGIQEGLTSVKTEDMYARTKYENLSFAFGDNKNAVWSMETMSLPKLVSTGELKFDQFKKLQIVQKPISYDENGNEIISYDYELMLANYGIKQNPYIVHDLKTWNNYFNENQTVKKGYYRIIKDIDFRAVGGNPSTSALTFSGNIQGNNMVLSNIMLYSNESLSSIGLFEKLEGINDKNIDNAVRNLTLSASSIWASSTSSVGVLAGIIEDFNVYNINIDSEGVIMVGGNAVGGLAGTVCGDFDLDLISSNIGANSTRASILTNYSIYMSKTNKKAERYNLNKVYYAGSVAGILDGYDKGLFNLSKREINKNYFKAKNIFVNGRITLFGDTVGCAFGLVGERVYVKNMTVDVSGSLFGHEYSAGAIGENRGVADNLKIVLADDVFEKSQYVSSGAVGFNLGGLVMNAEVSAKIIKTGYFQTVAGVIGRNVLGNVNNSSFDGELFGNITGGIIGANYNVDTFKKATTGSGAIAYECITNTNLVPLSEVQFTQNENVIKNYNKLSLSKNTFVYLIENSRKYYSYKHEDNNPTLSQITVKSKVLGLVIGLSNNSNIVEKPNTTTYNITLDSQKITFNSLTTEDYANQKLPSVTYEAEKADVELYRLNATNVILHTFKNINVLTMGAGGNFVMYLVGGEATSFDSWTTYSEEYILVQ